MIVKNETEVLEALYGKIALKSLTWLDGDKLRYKKLDSVVDIHRAMFPFPTTDLEALDYITEEMDESVIYVAEPEAKGAWYYWDGTRYVATKEDVAAGIAKALAANFKGLLDAAHSVADTLEEDEKGKFAKAIAPVTSTYRYFSSATGIRAVSYVLKLNPRDPSIFENDSEYIVLDNGRVLATSDLRARSQEPNPKRLVSRKLGVSLDGQDTAPEWFLETMEEWGLSKDEIKYLQQAAGCAILGKGGAKNIPTLFGISNTAKTTYINILASVFGGYAGKMGQGALVERGVNFEQHTARGKRFIYVEEPRTGKMDDAFLKAFADGAEGSSVETQRKGRDLEEWTVQGVLHIVTNKVPEMDFQDDAIVGRIDIVEFTKVYPLGAPGTDKLIGDKIFAAEGPAILRWVLEGAEAYLANDKVIQKPQSIKNRALDNVAESSPSLQWLTEKLEEGVWKIDPTIPPTNMVPVSKDLFNLDFEMWCNTNAIQMKDRPTRKQWVTEIQRYMKEPGAEAKKRPGGQRRFWNIREVQKQGNSFALPTSTPFEVAGSSATWKN